MTKTANASFQFEKLQKIQERKTVRSSKIDAHVEVISILNVIVLCQVECQDQVTGDLGPSLRRCKAGVLCLWR